MVTVYARNWHEECIAHVIYCHASYFCQNLRSSMDILPDIVLSMIFSYLDAPERICKVSRVCKRWYSLVNSSSQVWKSADFAYCRKITSDVLTKFIYPGTTIVLLNECCYLEWEDLKVILKKCKNIHVLSLSWIEQKCQLDITELRISQLRYLNLSSCLLSDKQFHEILKCKSLSVLILQASKGISKEAFESSCFKSHHHLRLLNVAYVPEALELSTVWHLLQHSNNTVKLDITGHKLSDEDLDTIERIDSTTFSRIVDIDDYRHLLYC